MVTILMLDLWALLLAQVDVIKLVFFNLVSILNNLETFVSEQTESTCDEADRVIYIITVATQRFVPSSRGIHLHAERDTLGAHVIFATDFRAFPMVVLHIGFYVGRRAR